MPPVHPVAVEGEEHIAAAVAVDEAAADAAAADAADNPINQPSNFNCRSFR
jgi:hypothetical protein